MKKRSEKQEDLDKLKVVLAKVSTVILSTFQGITVEDDTKLRRAVQAAGGKYQVVKNTLAERAGSGTPAEGLLGTGARSRFAQCVIDCLAPSPVRGSLLRRAPWMGGKSVRDLGGSAAGWRGGRAQRGRTVD